MGNCEMSGVVFPAADGSDPLRMMNNQNDILKLTKEDIHLPLNEREVFTLTKSWKAISKNMVNTGVAMFLKMFENCEEVKLMFEQFRTVDNVSDLTSSQALEGHALLVMTALDESFTNFDDEDYLVDMLLTTGKSHRRFEDFTGSIFWAIEQPFLDAVNETLGSRYTPAMDRLYRKAIRFILSTLIVGFTQAINEGRFHGGKSF